MVYSEKVDEIIDELANQKAHMLAIKMVSEKIVQTLSVAPGANYADESISVNDYMSKMFLDSGKGNFNTDVLSSQIMEDFERTVTIKPDAVADALIDKCNDFLEKQTVLIQDEVAEIKADFSLYSTFQFLNLSLIHISEPTRPY